MAARPQAVAATPDADPQPVPRAYREATGECFPRFSFEGDARADVAVVGAGITGLSAALTLAESGVDVLVLEAREAGAGASGRAFGQVVPYFKPDPAWLRGHYGTRRAEGMLDLAAGGPDRVFELVERHGIDCQARRDAIVIAAHHRSRCKGLQATAQYWRSRGAPVELVGGSELASLIGSERYALALVDARGGVVDVYGFARGLARAATSAGARIAERCPVRGVDRREDEWVLATDRGEVFSNRLLLATNAYSSAPWPDLGRSVLPLRVYGLVSRPLAREAAASVLPARGSLTDTRRLYSGIRVRSDGRLQVTAPGPAFRAGRADRAAATRRVLATFPQIDALEWEEEWAGWIALTRHQVPALHRLHEDAWAALGYSGRGIALATTLGRLVAEEALGDRNRVSPFPLSAPRPLPSRTGATLYVRAMLAAYAFLDRRDLRGIE